MDTFAKKVNEFCECCDAPDIRSCVEFYTFCDIHCAIGTVVLCMECLLTLVNNPSQNILTKKS